MDYSKEAIKRVSSLRIRTWTLTLAIIVSMISYFLINISLRQEIDWITFCFLALLQILVHCLYFPDGDLFGQKSEVFINNRKTYNEKASDVNANKKYAKLREFCKWEYEQKKKRYIENECSIIGISIDEFDILKQKSEQEIKELDKWEYDGKLMYFPKKKRKRLYKLIFGELPIEYNHPETIMSAIENDGSKAIHDESNAYKTKQYVFKILKSTMLGVIFGYIAYTVRDGFGINELVQIVMYITAIFSTAVMSFTSGEKTSKVFKNNFYVKLINFLDEFKEWDEKSVDNNNEK